MLFRSQLTAENATYTSINKELVTIHPSTMKKSFGHRKKAETTAEIRRLYGTVLTADEADAIGVGYTFIKYSLQEIIKAQQ